MRLYNKNLTSIDELRREQALLKARSENTISNLFSNNRNVAQGNARHASDNSDINFLQTGLDFATSVGAWNKAFALAIPALKLVGRKVQKSTLQVIAKDVLSAYLKWKLVMFSYRFAKNRIVNS